MNLSMRWLQDYVKIDVPMREYAEAMTMSGSKVEGYETEGEEITNVVVGKVLSIEKHPDADKLVICQVDVGDEQVQIVTGATNLYEGAIIPVAKDGSTLPGGKKIKKGKLRGVESRGMMCSIGELGLTEHDFPGNNNEGIMLLDEKEGPYTLGEDIRTALGLNDTSVEFEITSNRPDCLSMIGLARETAVTFDKELHLEEPVIKNQVDDIHNYLDVEIKAPHLCNRYVAKMVKNVKIEPSPRYIRERLRACGVRPINNIVDITNYVMLEYGQPMHAFDYRYVNGKKITVRTAQNGEEITTLDDVRRTLADDMLIIADEKGPMAVAGVMGGEFSSIMDDTNTIVFESACFNGPSVRITAKKLGMRTESSGRYEKGLDPHNCMPAALRACQLIEELGAGEVIDGVIDVKGDIKEPTVLTLDCDYTNRFLGTDIPHDTMVDILRRLDFKVEGDQITVPTYRADVEHKADVAEEIARIYGYNNIPTTMIRGSADAVVTETQQFERKIQTAMMGLGLNEIMTYSFISPKYYDKICMAKEDPDRESVVISNPLGEDTSIMRTTALPSIMEVVARNVAARNLSGKLYELASEYHPTGKDTLPIETKVVTMAMYGADVDFYDLKGAIEVLLDVLNIKELELVPCKDHPTFHPGRCVRLLADGEEVAIFGEVHPDVRANYGIKPKVYLADLSVEKLYQNRAEEKQYASLPKFPAATRDLALICEQDVPVLSIEKTIKEAAGRLLEKIELFDIYTGDQIDAGKKSVAFNLTFRDSEKTITDEQADGAIKKILKALAAQNISLRS